MRTPISKVLKDPARYLPIARKMIQQPLCGPFQDAPFYLQGQMDIHPKSRWHIQDFTDSNGGFFPSGPNTADRQISNLEPWDNTRRDMLILFLRTIVTNAIPGDFAEIGVYQGSTARLIHQYVPERELHLFDTFEGFTDRSVVAEKDNTDYTIVGSHFSDTSIEKVRTAIGSTNDNVKFHQGYFPDSIPPGFDERKFAFVHLDADLYEPTFAGLTYFYDRMSPNGLFVAHDYNAWPGARKAVDDFFADKPELPLPMPDKSGSAVIVKR